MSSFLLYTINPTEQMFKQLSGLLYYLLKTKRNKQTLVLPRFELNGKLYDYSEFYNEKLIKDNFNVISYKDYINIDNVKLVTNYELNVYNQLPFNFKSYMLFRNYIEYKNKYYEKVNLILKNKPKYIAVHWRQDDFLRIRPQCCMSADELIQDCILKLKKYNLNNLYIATDCKDDEKLNYIKSKLPVFTIDKTPYSEIDFSIIESLICTKSVYFTGTDTSLYTVNIIGERLKAGHNHHEQEIKKL
mgnify:FL=1